MNRYSWNNSKCKGIWLHNFQLVDQYESAVREVCEKCGMVKIFQIRNERIDNNEYVAFHNKQLLPKNHPLFSHEFQI